MKVVIQCAAGKRDAAKCMTTRAGKPVKFVAQPELAPQDADYDYARPDDDAGDGESWRARLRAYNAAYEKTGDNPLALLPAWRLYKPKIYAGLAAKFGAENVFIHSAGWGLIPAKFLTADYDITYSSQATAHKRRGKNDAYEDFCFLPNDGERVVFFGGKDYLAAFCGLTANYTGERICFYNSVVTPKERGVTLRHYETRTRTNWHYEAAQDFIDGKLAR